MGSPYSFSQEGRPLFTPVTVSVSGVLALKTGDGTRSGPTRGSLTDLTLPLPDDSKRLPGGVLVFCGSGIWDVP